VQETENPDPERSDQPVEQAAVKRRPRP